MLALTLQGLLDAGHEVRVVAPAAESAPVPENIVLHRIDSRRRSWFAASLHALREGRALTLVRHDQPALRRAVATCVAEWNPDIVHAEQLQAISNCAPAAAAGIPIVLRMQNVESAVWEQMAQRRFPAALLRTEARRLREGEQQALRQAARTVALTAMDAQALATPGVADRIACIEPAFPASEESGDAVAGDPALVLSGSGGWWPNAQGARWFFGAVWPSLHASLPAARLHVFGGDVRTRHAGIHWHAAPESSCTAFPRGAIAVVPLLAAAGIRMRILEAWARGLPVVATSVAARGLDIADGREALIADSPAQFAEAIQRVSSDPETRQRLIDAGRAYLRRHHDPARQTQALAALYAQVAAGEAR